MRGQGDLTVQIVLLSLPCRIHNEVVSTMLQTIFSFKLNRHQCLIQISPILLVIVTTINIIFHSLGCQYNLTKFEFVSKYIEEIQRDVGGNITKQSNSIQFWGPTAKLKTLKALKPITYLSSSNVTESNCPPLTLNSSVLPLSFFSILKSSKFHHGYYWHHLFFFLHQL